MEWNGMDGPPVAFAVAVAVAPASHSRPPVAQSSASEDGTRRRKRGLDSSAGFWRTSPTRI